jgi:hypothetical protein
MRSPCKDVQSQRGAQAEPADATPTIATFIQRATLAPHKGAARHSVDTLLDQQFDTLIVGHGGPIVTIGRDALASATGLAARRSAAAGRKKAAPARFTTKPCG